MPEILWSDPEHVRRVSCLRNGKQRVLYECLSLNKFLRHGSNALDSFTQLNSYQIASEAVRNSFGTVQTVKFDSPNLNLALVRKVV